MILRQFCKWLTVAAVLANGIFFIHGADGDKVYLNAQGNLRRAVPGSLIAIAFVVIPLALWFPGDLPFAAAFIAAPLTAFFVTARYNKNLGGYTGDALGLAVELGELCHVAFLFVILRVRC
jgi:cobalamin synthase